MENRDNQSTVLKSNTTNSNNGFLATTFENYFDGTVGCWCRIDDVPEGAEFIRHSTDRQGNITSSYWKVGDCVVRRSNHWGTKIANCDWWIYSATEKTKIPCWVWLKQHRGEFTTAIIRLSTLRHDLSVSITPKQVRHLLKNGNRRLVLRCMNQSSRKNIL